MMICTTTVRLHWRERFEGPPRPHLLRGAIAEQFPDEPLFHQHGKAGLIYRYPLIHYRWDKGDGLLAGFQDGARLLTKLPFLDLPLRLGERNVIISEAHIHCAEHGVSVSDKLVRYRFVTPWIPFNQENYPTYHAMDHRSKAIERDRLAIANILMMLRGLGVIFPERLYAVVNERRSVCCRYKDQVMHGILGTLITNVKLPDHVAIGRAVSHGYGWIQRE